MNMRTLIVPGLAASLVLIASSLSPISAQATTPVYLAASLKGANEVPPRA